MSLITVVVAIALIGFVTWLVITLIPMPAPFPRIIIAVVCVIVLIWLLQSFGLVGHFMDIKIK